MASGVLARPGSLRDTLEADGSLLLDRAAWQAIDDVTARVAGSMTIPSDDILIAVADDDPGIPVHAAWHRVQLESGPYTVEGDLADDAGLRPGSRPDPPIWRVPAAARRPPVRALEPGCRRRARRPRLINRYAVDRIRADLMLGFFFPGAVVDPIGTAGGVA